MAPGLHAGTVRSNVGLPWGIPQAIRIRPRSSGGIDSSTDAPGRTSNALLVLKPPVGSRSTPRAFRALSLVGRPTTPKITAYSYSASGTSCTVSSGRPISSPHASVKEATVAWDQSEPISEGVDGVARGSVPVGDGRSDEQPVGQKEHAQRNSHHRIRAERRGPSETLPVGPQ